MAIPNLKRFQKHVALKMENLANLEKSMVERVPESANVMR